ncbi:hypothetical protein BGZ52_013178 [Haplosporangium bisporale]|nr:hypothetical protein BGZ52_013178 [Haplosporangium bisporale]
MDGKSTRYTYEDVWRGQRVMKKRPQDNEMDESLRQEAAILKDLIDTHIIQYYDVEEEPFRLIMEYAEGGNLKNAIPTLLWEHKRRIAGEIAHGIAYIQSQGIIHCDIKSPNVLLTKKLEVKICDFGSAVSTSDKDRKPICGTPEWKAPELLLDPTAYSFKSDIYALGIIMWEMAAGYVPDRDEVLGDRLENVPEDYLVAMYDCLKLEPMSRPTARDLSIMKYERGLDEEVERCMWAMKDKDMSRKTFNITVAQSRGIDLKMDFDVQKKAVYYTFIDYGDLHDPVALKSRSTAESLLESANKGCDRSKAALALIYYESGQHNQALDLARQVSCIPVACYVIAEIYRHGHGVVDPNEGEAMRWHRDAANGGLSRSQVLIGLHCDEAGHEPEAAHWFRKAAVGGDRDGQYCLGEMIYYGRGVPLDREEGACWIRKAADQGKIKAADGMGIVCADLEDFPQAMQWFLKSGSPMAQYRIGVMYFNGSGVEANCAAAMEWLHKAADQRCGPAAFALAEMYLEGDGVKKDLDMAMQLYRRGDEYGHLDSTNKLALLLVEQGGKTKESGKLLKKAKEKGSILAAANLLLRYM